MDAAYLSCAMIKACRSGTICSLLVVIALQTVSTIGAESASAYLKKPAQWFREPEGMEITRNVLAWQTSEGAWPKNIDTTARGIGRRSERGTFDNGATIGELRLLARAFSATEDVAAREAFLKGFDHILRAQYPNGGWPQFFPPGDGYHRHITFNDQTMTRLMQFVRDVGFDEEFRFVDSARREAAALAFERGVKCILKSQVRANGALTVWCAQHDEVTLEPRPARTFELVSLSGAESVAILDLLMSIEKPSTEIIAAVDAGVAWFEVVQIKGVRQTKVDGDKRLMNDPSAPPLWARFYEIGTNRPIFAGRDGIKRYAMSEIEAERRNGYAWYGNWAQSLPTKHKRWKQRIAPSNRRSASPIFED